MHIVSRIEGREKLDISTETRAVRGAAAVVVITVGHGCGVNIERTLHGDLSDVFVLAPGSNPRSDS